MCRFSVCWSRPWGWSSHTGEIGGYPNRKKWHSPRQENKRINLFQASIQVSAFRCSNYVNQISHNELMEYLLCRCWWHTSHIESCNPFPASSEDKARRPSSTWFLCFNKRKEKRKLKPSFVWVVLQKSTNLMQLETPWVSTVWTTESKTEYIDDENFSSHSSRKENSKTTKDKKPRWFSKRMEVLYSYFSTGTKFEFK